MSLLKNTLDYDNIIYIPGVQGVDDYQVESVISMLSVLSGLPKEKIYFFPYEHIMDRKATSKTFKLLSFIAATAISLKFGINVKKPVNDITDKSADALMYFNPLRSGLRKEIQMEFLSFINQHKLCFQKSKTLVIGFSLGSVIGADMFNFFGEESYVLHADLLTIGSPLGNPLLTPITKSKLNKIKKGINRWFNVWSIIDPVCVNRINLDFIKQHKVICSHDLPCYLSTIPWE